MLKNYALLGLASSEKGMVSSHWVYFMFLCHFYSCISVQMHYFSYEKYALVVKKIFFIYRTNAKSANFKCAC